MFKKKKKKEEVPEQEEELPSAEEDTDKTEYEEQIAALNERIEALDKKATKATAKKPTEPEGKFSLNENEMTLAVNALASSEEFKVYQQMVIGQQIAAIIAEYSKAVEGKKSEVSSGEDTEEKLPTE